MRRLLLLLALLAPSYLEAATGQVLVSGTPIGTAGQFGSTLANLFDGNLTTNWTVTISGSAWAGLDLGSGNALVLTRYRLAPQQTTTHADYSFEINGSLLQASNDCTFATGVVTLDTIPSSAYFQELQLTERTVSGSTGYRCFRLYNSTAANTNLAELQFIGTISAGAPAAQPVTPTISTWGGINPSGSAIVSLACITTSASIYYTTDGSTPTNTHGSLYSVPFAVTVPSSGAITVNAVAYDSTLSPTLSSAPPGLAATAAPFYIGYQPVSTWNDNLGHKFQGYNPYITQSAGVYYLIGVPINTNSSYNSPLISAGINLYSSTDLYHWTYVSQILQTPNPTLYAPYHPSVLFNASTGNWVLWAWDGINALAMTATASAITGPWTWINLALNPDGSGFEDGYLFLDSTGIAYVFYTIGGHSAMSISQLSSDFLSTTGALIHPSWTTQREGGVMWKNNGVYFLLTSKLNAYDSTSEMDQEYETSSSPLGTYSSESPLFATDPLGTNYNGQSSATFNVNGTWLYMSEYWIPGTPQFGNSFEVWLPLTYPTSTIVVAGIPASWSLPSSNIPTFSNAILIHAVIE